MTDAKKVIPGFITVDEALKVDKKTVLDLQLKHMNTYRTQSGIDIGATDYMVRAEGCRMWDYDGNEHLDFIGSVGCGSLGNNNPFVIESIKKIMDSHPVGMDPLALKPITACFAANMSKVSPGGKLTKITTCTGGAEAMETAMKMVRIACGRGKEGKTKLVACTGAFHGKTAGTVSLGGKAKWRKWQEPLLVNVQHVPFGDVDALEHALEEKNVMGFFCETIQGEGGINVAPDGYFQKARELCTKYDAYMVVDEIQCGMARTGKMWCIDHYGVVPDALTFAKSIGAGMMPVAGCMATEELYNAAYGSDESCFHHTATYQDNTLSGGTALAVLQYVIENGLADKAAETGKYFFGKLNEIKDKYPDVIKEVRGKGLMIGIECHKNSKGEYYTIPICATMANKYRVHTMFSINNETVFRALPPLEITKDDIAWFLDAFEKAIVDVVEAMGK